MADPRSLTSPTGMRMAAVLAMLIALTGCSSHRAAQSTFKDPEMDFGLIRTVAVVPFGNLTSSPRAADRVRDVFMTMLQATGAVYVLPPGEIARGISRVSPADPTSPTAEEAVALGKNLDADVIITGTVLEYGEVRSASAVANVISLSLEMVETGSGKVVWSSSSTKGGIGAGKRLLGGGGEPMNVVTVDAVDELLDQLFK
ncbi:MAG TPA: hypothetical protein VNI57_06820 [Candidatus Saccharimonadales bacterium]|nr:hypothetical protein [Candidatus Saccharimonadales bacterium]